MTQMTLQEERIPLRDRIAFLFRKQHLLGIFSNKSCGGEASPTFLHPIPTPGEAVIEKDCAVQEHARIFSNVLPKEDRKVWVGSDSWESLQKRRGI